MKRNSENNETTKSNCKNFDESICNALDCSECGMNEANYKPIESQFMTIIPINNIGDSVKGTLLEIIPSPFTDSKYYRDTDRFLKFNKTTPLKKSDETFYINMYKDLERITNENIGKFFTITLERIDDLPDGNKFKRFSVLYC
jgi:hypothetical protein